MNDTVLAVVLALSMLPGRAAGIPEVQRNLAPRVEAASTPVAGAVLTVGHATFTFKEGSAAVFKAGGEPAGIYFKGRGTLQYLSADADEWPVMAYNLAKNSTLKPARTEQGQVVTMAITGAVIWTRNQTLPALDAGGGPDLSADFKADQLWFHPDGESAPAMLLAETRLNRPDATTVYAQVRNPKEGMRYRYSSNDRESLETVRQDMVKGRSFLQEALVSEQCLGWSRKDPLPGDWALIHVDLDLATPDNLRANLRVQETLMAIRPGLQVLRLDLNSYKWYQPGGLASLEKIPVILASVKDEAGHELPFEHRNGEVLVCLPAAPEPSAPFKLTFAIRGDFLIPHGRDCYWELGVEPWFPQPELSGMDYTLQARVKVPKDYAILMGGETVARSEEGGCNILEKAFDKPVCFFAIAAGHYTVKEEMRNGFTVRLAGYSGLGTSSDTLFKLAFEIIGYYQTFLGPYPFKEFNIVERNELGHGQAPPGFMFITEEAFQPIKDTLNRIFASEWINQAFAHELAHQWFGIEVKMWSAEDQWLGESFAEYCSALAMLHMKGKGQDAFDKIRAQWKQRATPALQASSIALANRLRPGDLDEEDFGFRMGLVYSKGALLLDALHKEMGDAAFFRFLHLYVNNLAWKVSRTSDLNDFLKYVTGKDHTKFLDDYYWGTAMP